MGIKNKIVTGLILLAGIANFITWVLTQDKLDFITFLLFMILADISNRS